MKKSLLPAFVFLTCYAFGKPSNPLSSFYFSAGANLWLVQDNYCYTPYHMPGRAFEYSALPVRDFNEGEGPTLSNRGNYSISLGWQSPWNHCSVVQLELGFAQTSFKGTNGQCLRYTDQVMENRGFVVNSEYQLNSLRQSNRYVFLRPKILLQSTEQKITQRMGIGLFAYWVLGSSYYLNMNGPESKSYYYQHQDLQLSDKVWALNPEIIYQIQLAEIKQNRVFFSCSISPSRLHFTQLVNGHSSRNQDRPILHIGLLLE